MLLMYFESLFNTFKMKNKTLEDEILDRVFLCPFEFLCLFHKLVSLCVIVFFFHQKKSKYSLETKVNDTRLWKLNCSPPIRMYHFYSQQRM